jgi:hypothetical protein
MNPDPIILFVSFFAVAGVLFGIVLIRRGFANLKTRRFVESLPASRIRSMALGPVELNGVIGPGLEMPDPVYQRPCVYYGLTVEHRVLTIEDGSVTHQWITLLDEGSGLRPFWLVDPTAQTLVWAPDAELRYAANHNFTCGFFGSLFGSSAELEFLRRVKKQRVFMRRVRLSLQVLRPGTPLFVVGCAATPDSFKPANNKFADALREAAALDRGRVIVRGDGPFVIARSAPQVTEQRGGMFMHVVTGVALILASVLVFEFFWQIGVP